MGSVDALEMAKKALDKCDESWTSDWSVGDQEKAAEFIACFARQYAYDEYDEIDEAVAEYRSYKEIVSDAEERRKERIRLRRFRIREFGYQELSTEDANKFREIQLGLHKSDFCPS